MAKCIRPKKIESEEISKKHYTKKELKSKEVLHEILAEYDRLLTRYNNNPTASNKRDLQKYAYHLENPSRLTSYFLTYTQNNEINDASEGERQIRRLIKEELELGELIKVDGLIRNPGTIPSDNVSATGNTVTILIPPTHINNLVEKLKVALVNESARIIVPCSNMIIVIETGSYTNAINDDLYHAVCKTVTDYVCGSSTLKTQKPSNSIKIVII